MVILDVIMPGMDGIHVCQKIKDNPDTNDIQVLILTGKNTDETFEKAVRKKADWYIVKPYDVVYLLKILAMLIKKKK